MSCLIPHKTTLRRHYKWPWRAASSYYETCCAGFNIEFADGIIIPPIYDNGFIGRSVEFVYLAYQLVEKDVDVSPHLAGQQETDIRTAIAHAAVKAGAPFLEILPERLGLGQVFRRA